jgi:hypothetical protein
LVNCAGYRVVLQRGVKEPIAKKFCVGRGESEGGEKHASLVPASYMCGAQAVIAQLANIDDGAPASWKIHSKERIR